MEPPRLPPMDEPPPNDPRLPLDPNEPVLRLSYDDELERRLPESNTLPLLRVGVEDEPPIADLREPVERGEAD